MKKHALKSETVRIPCASGKERVIILSPKKREGLLPGILWIHGGGYVTGMAEMVYASCGKMLAEQSGAVVVAPNYALMPYPIPLEDCAAALDWMTANAAALGIDKTRIVIGGESAGGGLTAALCLYARDRDIPVKLQLPLYPMLDYQDTKTSRDNHGHMWNTRRNHYGWKQYLRLLDDRGTVPAYASAARETDLRGLPLCYTFVLDGEPFFEETIRYVQRLKEAGVPAELDVYHGDVHAFDMLTPWTKEARAARRKLCEVFEELMNR